MAKKHAVGTLDRRVELVRYDTIKSTTGSPEKTEQSLGAFWAKVDDVSGTEAVEGQVISLAVRKYVMRWQQQLVDDGVLIYIKDADGQYNINSVSNLGRKEYLELKTSKRE